MSSRDNGFPVFRRLGFAILAITVGLPLLGFFVAITWGAIAIPLLALLLVSPLVLIDYFARRASSKAAGTTAASPGGSAGARSAPASDSVTPKGEP